MLRFPMILPISAALLSLACDQGLLSSPPPAGPDAAAISPAASVALAHPEGAKPPSPETLDASRDAARRLAGSIVVGGQAMKTLTELTDTIGPRLTGSDAHKKAAGWASERFRSYGVDAALESFTIKHAWTRGEAKGKVVAPTEHALHVASMGWTTGTPSVRGELFKLDEVSVESIEKHKNDVKGKIA
jgi:carboxypeptidase Q